MTRSLGCDHAHVHLGWRLDLIEADVEAVSEHESVSGFQIGGDVALIEVVLRRIGDQKHDHTGGRNGLSRTQNSQTLGFRLRATFRPLMKTYEDLDAAVT